MTTADVKAILGEPTNSQTGSALGIISGTTYIYHTSTSDVKITFVDDKVIATEGEFQMSLKKVGPFLNADLSHRSRLLLVVYLAASCLTGMTEQLRVRYSRG